MNPSLPDPQVALRPALVEKPALPRLSDAERLTPNPVEAIRDDSPPVIPPEANEVMLEADQDAELFNPETPNWTPEEAQQLLEMEQRLDALEAVEPNANVDESHETKSNMLEAVNANPDMLEVPKIEPRADENVSIPQVQSTNTSEIAKTNLPVASEPEVPNDHKPDRIKIEVSNSSDPGPPGAGVGSRGDPGPPGAGVVSTSDLDPSGASVGSGSDPDPLVIQARQVPVFEHDGAAVGASDPARKVDGLGQDDFTFALPSPESMQREIESETRQILQNDVKQKAETSSPQTNQDLSPSEPDLTLEQVVSVDPTVQPATESLPTTDLEMGSSLSNGLDLNIEVQTSIPIPTELRDVSESPMSSDLLAAPAIEMATESLLENTELTKPRSLQATDVSTIKNVGTEPLSSASEAVVSQADAAAIQKSVADRVVPSTQAEQNPAPVEVPRGPSQSAPTTLLQEARDEIVKRSEDVPSRLDQVESVESEKQFQPLAVSESESTIDGIAEKLEQVFPLRSEVLTDSSVAPVETVSEVVSAQENLDGEARVQSSELEVSSTSESIALEQSTSIPEHDGLETANARVIEQVALEPEVLPVMDIPTLEDHSDATKIDQPQKADATTAPSTENKTASVHLAEPERLQSVSSSELQLPLDRDSRVVETIRPRHPRPQRAQPLEVVESNVPAPETKSETLASESTVLDQDVIDQMFKAWPKPGDRVANPEPVRTERLNPVRFENPEKTVSEQLKIPGSSEAIPQESDANESVSQSEGSSKQDSDDAVLADANDPLLAVLFKVWARPTDRFENADLPSSESANDPVASQLTDTAITTFTESREVRDAPSVPRRDRRVVRPRVEQFVTPADLNAEVEPLPEATRRFLKPVVGIDPNEVRLHRGIIADGLADDHNADAVTVGEDVFISSQASHDPVAQLGLLAHEFTHAARNRQARFVPSAAKQSFSEVASSEEESVALNVERQARAQAQLETNVNDSIASSVSESRDWRGLPAPWEPMPDFGQAFMSTPGPSAEASVTSLVPNYVPSFAPNTSAPSSLVQAAERGRDLEPVQQSASTEQASSPAEPNLDALANQIYTILKRRLQTETRRGF